MGAGRVGPGVAEAEVEGDQGPLVGDGADQDVGAGVAGELLVYDGVDAVPAPTNGCLASTVMFSSSLILTGWA